MSDAGRQSFTDKVANKGKPDSEKSLLEQGQDYAAGTYDSVASTAQPESQKSTTQKSTTQKAGDTLSGNQKDNSDSLLDKAKNAFGAK